ncbi:hypothetical protein [uncultured Chryseobacterium sp.]|uniref:hypothetical protein n=1 Tax=uncultured Chryseobacterium sp. TaxID=259322 RepID=UPI00263699F2|nr:hypothetical protein [uncultured Chryseobacterium sp.]
MKKFKYIFLLIILAITAVSCHRDEFFSDDIPQEEITNIILKVKDISTQITSTYNFNMGQGNLPEIKIQDGHVYDVELVFMNGNEDETEAIKLAKDEHFVLFDFPASQIQLERTDDASSTRDKDGMKLGLLTRWNVIKTINGTSPVLKISLIHDAKSVSEQQNGTEWGSTKGGETDAEAIFSLKN